MNRNNLLNVLDELLTKAYLPCEWRIDWEEDHHYIDIALQFSLPNKTDTEFIDQTGKQPEQDYLIFEKRLIFYNEAAVNVIPKGLLKAIPMPDQEGLPYGEIFATVKYLKNIATSVRILWLDFLREENEAVFDLTWNERHYQAVKDQLKDSYRYSDMRVYFPK